MNRCILAILAAIIVPLTLSGCGTLDMEALSEKLSKAKKKPAATQPQTNVAGMSFKGNAAIECNGAGQKKFYQVRANHEKKNGENTISLLVTTKTGDTIYSGTASFDPATTSFTNQADKMGAQLAISDTDEMYLRGIFPNPKCPYKQHGVFKANALDKYTDLQ